MWRNGQRVRSGLRRSRGWARWVARSAFSLAIFSLALSWAPAAAADALKAKAQELLTEGNQLVTEGDFGTALVKYRTAYELFASPKLLINIGTALRHVGRNAEAATTYERYLADPGADAARTEELRGILAELDAMVGRLNIAVAEPGVRVSVDGQLLVLTDRRASLRVDPGRHTVVAEKPGREPVVRHITAAGGASERLLLVLGTEGESSEPVSTWRIVGYGIAGLGGAGLIAGGVLGVFTLMAKADADDHCAVGGRYAGYCSEQGAELSDDARTLGTVATTAALLGFAAAATGLAIAFSAGDDGDPSVAFTFSPAAHTNVAMVVQW